MTPNKQTAIVVGAGLGGMSVAALLAKEGYSVTVVEKNSMPGGRGMQWKTNGFLFDMGPSWYLMPEVFEKYFAAFGKKTSDYYTLKRLDPSYRVFFEGEQALDIPADKQKAKKIFDTFEDWGGAKLEKYLADSEFKYDVAMNEFIYKDYTSLTDFLSPKLIIQGLQLRLFESIDRYAHRYFTSDKSRKLNEYSMVFLGSSPHTTPALYSLMSHVDFTLGVWYPCGGMYEMMHAFYRLGIEQGVRYQFNTPVTKIIVSNKKAIGVQTKKGKLFADHIIVNADYAYAETTLLEKEHQTYSKTYWKKKKIAPSALLFYIGTSKKIKSLRHHNLFLAKNWDEHFEDIFKHPCWPQHPSYYVGCPSQSDTTVAPKNNENIFVLVPVASGLIDTQVVRDKYFKHIINDMEERTGEKIAPYIKVKRIVSQKDFSSLFNAYEGTALGLAHTLFQTALFRPQHASKKVKGLYYTGQYTHPGIGLPMVIISAHILAHTLTHKPRQ